MENYGFLERNIMQQDVKNVKVSRILDDNNC